MNELQQQSLFCLIGTWKIFPLNFFEQIVRADNWQKAKISNFLQDQSLESG
jgi:hypothetical protein